MRGLELGFKPRRGAMWVVRTKALSPRCGDASCSKCGSRPLHHPPLRRPAATCFTQRLFSRGPPDSRISEAKPQHCLLSQLVPLHTVTLGGYSTTPQFPELLCASAALAPRCRSFTLPGKHWAGIYKESRPGLCLAMVTMWWPCLVLALLSGLETSGFPRSPLRLLEVSVTFYMISEF